MSPTKRRICALPKRINAFLTIFFCSNNNLGADGVERLAPALSLLINLTFLDVRLGV